MALVLAANGAPRMISPEGSAFIDPQIASSGNQIYVASGAGDRIFVQRSIDNGSSFERPVALPSTGRLSLGMRRGPRIVAVKGALVVSAILGANGGGRDGDLMAWRSIDGGKTWGQPVRVSDTPGAAREGLHAMAAGPGGQIACAWLDLRNRGTEIWTAESRDGGASWSRNVKVYSSPSGTVCECCHPSLAFGFKGDLFVMFRNWLGGSRDMYLSHSTDGRSFETTVKLGAGTWPLSACPMDGGAVVVQPDGTVLTAWRREGNVFVDRPGEPEQEIGEGTQPWLGSDGTVVYQNRGRVFAQIGSKVIELGEGKNPVVASRKVVWADNAGRVWFADLKG